MGGMNLLLLLELERTVTLSPSLLDLEGKDRIQCQDVLIMAQVST